MVVVVTCGDSLESVVLDKSTVVFRLPVQFRLSRCDEESLAFWAEEGVFRSLRSVSVSSLTMNSSKYMVRPAH